MTVTVEREPLEFRRLRGGIVGGGQGAFIGVVHRMAAELDGEAWIVAGALSSDPVRARESAKRWYLQRSYDSYQEMARAEAARADGIDFVIIATPNHLHYPVARAFIDAGIAVICDKPLAHTLEEAQRFAELVTRSQVPFALTHTYSGYPAVREARERVAQGFLGELRRVQVEYLQDWLREPLEQGDNKQAGWRGDPARAGLGGSIADIGTHAHQLLEFVSGQQVSALCADLSVFVPGRRLDDDANVLLRLAGGAKGVLSCSQIACGEDNDLRIRLYGTRGGLDWRQEEPNTLILKPAGEPWQHLRVGSAAMSAAARAATRLPAGHPEGYIEAFAVIYRNFFADLRRRAAGEPLLGDYPGADDGLRGLRFVARAIESSLAQGWVVL